MRGRALLGALLLLQAAASAQESRWLLAARSLLDGCWEQGWRRVAGCARSRAWRALDEMLQDDVIPVVGGLELVRLRRKDGRESVEQPANASLTFDVRQVLRRVRERNLPAEEEDPAVGLTEQLSSRVSRLLRTHVIKIDFERLLPDAPAGRSADAQVEPRGRRRRRRQMQMLPIIMMGVLLMGTVLIPMGFQFLAVLGGKALILAKMALMLSSIQGLKKVATSGVNYGLYHSPVPETWHERSTGTSSLHYEVPYGPAAAHHLDGLGQQHFAGRSAVQPT